MTIYDRLSQDHQRVRDIIGQIKDTGDSAEKSREKLFMELKENLVVHTNFENEIFYPAVRKNSDAKDAIDEAINEHDEVEAVLDELDEMEKTEVGWIDTVEKLEEMLLHHIDEEEGQVFELGRKTISDDDARKMAEQYEQQKKSELKRSA